MEKTDIAEAFRIALQFLWDGAPGPTQNPQHFCNCILRAKKLGLITFSQHFAATKFIEKKLGKHYTVIGWLETQPGFAHIQKTATYRQLQEYRKAWVLSMIKELNRA